MLAAVADRALDPEAVWGKFARDSPLEEAGFELPVPLAIGALRAPKIAREL
jgi:hypothetical protein